MDIPIEIFESDIFDVIKKITPNEPCYMCARMRRGYLYSKAKELGCNKIALGHHFSDVIETTLLSMFYSSEIKTMMPKLHSDNFEGIELIRPLYYVEEEAIKRFIKYTGLWPLNCACMVAAEKIGNKRHEIKALIAELKKTFNDVDKSIFKSAANVNMNSILGWEKDGDKYSFLDPEMPKNK
jgi:tRNA(Ile)-lysidine synthase TilS/MesJ